MSDATITLREVFEVPNSGAAPQKAGDGWKKFQDRVTREVKGIKTAAMPDVTRKFAELLDIPLPNIFLASWKKADSLQTLLAESVKTPEAVSSLELAEHTINSLHKPWVEVKLQGTTVKKIEFTVRLAFQLKAFVLKIQNGSIKEMQTGSCEAKGTVEYEGLTILEKKLAPIVLPGTIPLELSGRTNSENA